MAKLDYNRTDASRIQIAVEGLIDVVEEENKQMSNAIQTESEATRIEMKKGKDIPKWTLVFAIISCVIGGIVVLQGIQSQRIQSANQPDSTLYKVSYQLDYLQNQVYLLDQKSQYKNDTISE